MLLPSNCFLPARYWWERWAVSKPHTCATSISCQHVVERRDGLFPDHTPTRMSQYFLASRLLGGKGWAVSKTHTYVTKFSYTYVAILPPSPARTYVTPFSYTCVNSTPSSHSCVTPLLYPTPVAPLPYFLYLCPSILTFLTCVTPSFTSHTRVLPLKPYTCHHLTQRCPTSHTSPFLPHSTPMLFHSHTPHLCHPFSQRAHLSRPLPHTSHLSGPSPQPITVSLLPHSNEVPPSPSHLPHLCNPFTTPHACHPFPHIPH